MLVGARTIGLAQQQRNLKGSPLRARQGGERLVERPGQQVTEGREGEPGLRLGRRRGEHPPSAFARRLHPGPPDLGLADARLAGDDQRACRAARLEQPLELGACPLAADQFHVASSRSGAAVRVVARHSPEWSQRDSNP